MVVLLVCRALFGEIQCTSKDLLMGEESTQLLPSLKRQRFELFWLELEYNSEIWLTLLYISQKFCLGCSWKAVFLKNRDTELFR